MQTAALQAERTFVTGVEIRLADGPVPGPPPQVTIRAQTGLAELGEPNRWRADLAIVARPADEQRPLPYQIAISVSGIFRVIADMVPAAARRWSIAPLTSATPPAARVQHSTAASGAATSPATTASCKTTSTPCTCK